MSGSRDERELFDPSQTKSRRELAAALSRWRTLDPKLCAEAHEREPIETKLCEEVSSEQTSISRRIEARSRLLAAGVVNDMGMTVTDGHGDEESARDCAGPKAMGRWLSQHRNVASCERGGGSIGEAEVKAFVNKTSSGNSVSFPSSVQGRLNHEPSYLRAIARKLKKNTQRGDNSGREDQMEAGRTYRRTSEITFLLDERRTAEDMDKTRSPWHDSQLEPPAASMGNAIAWIKSEGPSLSTSMNRRANSNSTSVQPSNAPRRVTVCSCCSQPRSLGHVKTCMHTNKSCSRCRERTTSDAN